MGRRPNVARPAAAALIFASLLSVRPVVAEVPVCSATAQTVCSCDLTMLRPLQGAVGIEEVAYKQKKISKHADREREKLKAEPIQVLLGPDGQLFIIDHHHGAKAWLQSGTKEAFCQVVNSEKNLPSAFETEEQFWALLEKAHLARLKNEKGLDINLPNCPKRSMQCRTILTAPLHGSFAKMGVFVKVPANLLNSIGLTGLGRSFRT